MKDKDFYGGGEHPEAGSELVYINGKWLAKPEVPPSEKERHDTYDIYHPKCKSKYSDKIKNKTQNKIEKKTLSSVGFSRSRKIEDSSSERTQREQQLDRLTLMKTNRARLQKQLAQIESVIKSIETDLSI